MSTIYLTTTILIISIIVVILLNRRIEKLKECKYKYERKLERLINLIQYPTIIIILSCIALFIEIAVMPTNKSTQQSSEIYYEYVEDDDEIKL